MTVRASILMIFAVLLIGATPAVAQQLKTVGVRTEHFNKLDTDQEESQWCWAACIEMIMKLHGVEIEQEDIVRRSYGTDPYGRLPNFPGNERMIASNLNGSGLDNTGKQYSVQCAYHPGVPSDRAVINELKNGRPIIFGYWTGPNSAHAVVCTAVRYQDSPRGPIIRSVIVRDPWPQTLGDENGRVEYDAAQFKQDMRGSFAVKVRTGGPGRSASIDERDRHTRPCLICDGAGRVLCAQRCESGVLICRGCAGQGGQACRGCSGVGRVPCPYGRCYQCAGTGALVCRACAGRGGFVCNSCSGIGSRRCNRCRQGQEECRSCNGSGER